MEMVQLDLDRLLGSGMRSSSAQTASSDTVHALHHFRNVTSKTLGSENMRTVMYEWVPQSAWQQAFVMHLIVALSSAHLRYLRGMEIDRRYTLLELVHWQCGLRDYRVALSAAGPTSSQEQGDALVTGTLLSMYYTNRLENTLSLEAFDTDYDAAVNAILTPLAVSRGMSVLRTTLGTFTSASAFSSVFRPGPVDDLSIADGSRIFLLLDKICRLHNTNAYSKGLTRRVADILAPMVSSSNIENNPDLILSFGGVAYPEIRTLLAERSPEVMMLLLCWFASLAKTKQWWANARMKSQSAALKNHLLSMSPPVHYQDAWSDCLSAVLDYTEDRAGVDDNGDAYEEPNVTKDNRQDNS
jgi:hypothetical protein